MSVAAIFIRAFGMQLLVKNSNVKDSLMQTEAINLQSPLRDGIIADHLPLKYHEPVSFS